MTAAAHVQEIGRAFPGQLGICRDDQIPELRGDVTGAMAERPANEVVARALAWIDRTPDKFFGWVHVFDPHFPYAPPAKGLEKLPPF